MPLTPTTIEEAALIAVLDAFGRTEELREHFVLKGGNALRWIYQGPRASVDLDFSSKVPHPSQPKEESAKMLASVEKTLNQNLLLVATSHQFERMIVQSSKVLPKRRDVREFPALELKVGYTRKPGAKWPFPQAIKVEISLNEVVCDYSPWQSGSLRVSVSTLDEIISEKLRAILQQEKRKRFRSSDVYDIWFFWSHTRRRLDLKKISLYLLQKSAERDNVGEVVKSRFQSTEIRARSEHDYAVIAERLLGNAKLPPFDKAYGKLLELVSLLDIPE